MKKFLMIAVAAMAVASQAASVKWQLSPTTDAGYAVGQTALLFVGTANETFTHGDDTGLTLSDYVAALLADGADKATEAAFDTATTIAGRGGAITTAAKTKDPGYAAGTGFVGMIVILDTANDKYSAFSFATEMGLADVPLNTASAASSTNGFQDMPTAGPTIPEPATGALALAGVALLFKRRRA